MKESFEIGRLHKSAVGFVIIYEMDMNSSILCLTLRTAVTSVRIPEEDACHRARNLCVFSHVQKGTPRLTHKRCVLQRVSLGTLSDVAVVLGMRQSIVRVLLVSLKEWCSGGDGQDLFI